MVTVPRRPLAGPRPRAGTAHRQLGPSARRPSGFAPLSTPGAFGPSRPPPLHTGPAQRPAPSLSTSPPTGSSSTPERSHHRRRRRRHRRHLAGCREPRAAWDIPISASLKLHWNQSRGGGASPPPAVGPNTFLKGGKNKMCTVWKLALSGIKTCLAPP